MQLSEYIIQTILYIRLLRQDEKPSEDILYLQHPHYKPKLVKNHQLCPKDVNHCRLVVIGDTHEQHDQISSIKDISCDLFVHCGDILLTNRHFSTKTSVEKLRLFNNWLGTIPATHKILIGGNHDNVLEKLGHEHVQKILSNAVYLQNHHFSLGKLSIWGCPLSEGTSKNKAFQSEEFRQHSICSAPQKVDILVSHGHCPELEKQIDHKIHLWGHAHNSYGVKYIGEWIRSHPVNSLSICSAIMDASFNLTHPPIVLDIPKDLSGAVIPQSSSDLINLAENSLLSITNRSSIRKREPANYWLQNITQFWFGHRKVFPEPFDR